MSKQGTSAKDLPPSAADLLGPYLIQQCELLLEITDELRAAVSTGRRRSEPDHGSISPERVHDGRVCCRRLRSTIKVYGDFLSTSPAERLIDDAGWYASRLGAVRDLDVVGERISQSLERLGDDLVLHEADRELETQIDYRRRIAVAGLRDAVHDEMYSDLIDQLTNWRQQPPLAVTSTKPASKIKKLVKRAEQELSHRLRTAAVALSTHDPDAGDLVHAARRSGKRLRYASEVALPILGPHAEQRLTTFINLQDLLGDYQDSRVASALLRDLGGIPGRNGFTFGVLHAQESEHRRRLSKKIAKRAAGL